MHFKAVQKTRVSGNKDISFKIQYREQVSTWSRDVSHSPLQYEIRLVGDVLALVDLLNTLLDLLLNTNIYKLFSLPN